MSPKFDVIVIGLGTAGSAAASVLAAAGKKVLALEAQNRVGGRVHTVPYANGVVELGAEWIHGTESSPIYDLALKHNIPLVSQEISYKIAHSKSQGKTPKREALIDELIGYGLQVWDNPPRNTESLGQNITKKINQYVKTNHPAIQNDTDFINNIIEFVELTVGNYEACYDWNNATTQTSYKSLEGDQHMSWHKNGYKTMFDILLNTYNNGSGHPSLEIKLNTEVTEIRSPQHPSEAVVVTTREGTTYTANAVIVTMSIGVLKERYKTLFSPQLPSDKVKAIEFLQIGLLDKVELHFAEPWWSYPGEMFNFFWDKKSRDSVSEEDTWITKIVFISNPMGSNKTMTVWFSGDQAKQMETLPDNIVKMKSMEVIRKFLGADRNIPDPIDILRTNWYSNPFTRGSYSYEHLATPSYPSARSDLALPIADSAGSPRLLFAGEATETKHFSTVHGAFESGIREAKRLLKTSFCASL